MLVVFAVSILNMTFDTSMSFIVKRARAEGFMVYQFAERFPEAHRQLAQWLTEGRITCRETIAEGIENAPKAFIGLFTGQNIGKQLVRVAQT